MLTRKSLLGTIFVKRASGDLEYVCYASKVMNPWITSSTLVPSATLSGTEAPSLFVNLIEIWTPSKPTLHHEGTPASRF